MASGSGSGIAGTMAPEQPQSAWVSGMQAWGSDLNAWTVHERSLNNPTPPFPQSMAAPIIQELSLVDTTEAIRSNSKQWSNLVDDWRNISTSYTRTYEDMCPEMNWIF